MKFTLISLSVFGFWLCCVTVTLGPGIGTSLVLPPHPPEITICTGPDAPMCTHAVDAESRRYFLVPSKAPSITLRCEASYPVMWTLDSLEQPWINGTASERIVGQFKDSSTYKYAMLLKLSPNWKISDDERKALRAEFACFSVSSGSEVPADTTHDTVVLKWEGSLDAFVLSLTLTFERRRKEAPKNSNVMLGMEGVPTLHGNKFHQRVTCCIKPGAYPEKIRISDLALGHTYCTEPLICMTTSSAPPQINYFSSGYSWDNDTRCVSYLIQYSPDAGFTPAAYTCAIGSSRNHGPSNCKRFAADQMFWGIFNDVPLCLDASDFVDLVDLRNSSDVRFEYQIGIDSKRGWVRMPPSPVLPVHGQTPNPILLYTGDTLTLRCGVSAFVYAKGIVMELGFKNGTSQFVSKAEWKHKAELRIRLVDANTNLSRVSCHARPWNSTEWITQFLPVKVEASTKPLSPSGASVSHENASFYTHQSAELRCEFTATPPPTFAWNSNGGGEYTLRPDGSNARITVSARYLESDDDPKPIPPKQITCTATNVAGNAAKVFNIQAIRSVRPTMANGARMAVVMYAGDNDAALNCTLEQGTPNPEFYWQRNGHNVSGTLFPNLELRQPDSDPLTSRLVFKDVHLDDEAEYTCWTHNFRGSVSKGFSVRVREGRAPPSPSAYAGAHWSLFALMAVTTVLVLLIVTAVMVWVYRKQSQRISRLEAAVEFSRAATSVKVGQWLDT